MTLSEQAHMLYVQLETERRRAVSDILRERLQRLRDRAYVRLERRIDAELIAWRDKRAGRFSDMPTDPEDE